MKPLHVHLYREEDHDTIIVDVEVPHVDTYNDHSTWVEDDSYDQYGTYISIDGKLYWLEIRNPITRGE